MQETEFSPVATEPGADALDTFQSFDFESAHREGWTLSDHGVRQNGSRRIEIQQLDDLEGGKPRFREDRDAWAHVVRRARAGSPLHRQALALVDRLERIAIQASFGSW